MLPTKIHFAQIHYHPIFSNIDCMNFQNYTWSLSEYVALFEDHIISDPMIILSSHHNSKS